jgi:hypothetical protein
MNHEWSITCMVGTLWGRIALQNRTFEGGEIDLLRKLVEMWEQAAIPVTAELLEGILADELQHVRYANQWLQRMGRENPVVLAAGRHGGQLREEGPEGLRNRPRARPMPLASTSPDSSTWRCLRTSRIDASPDSPRARVGEIMRMEDEAARVLYPRRRAAAAGD